VPENGVKQRKSQGFLQADRPDAPGLQDLRALPGGAILGRRLTSSRCYGEFREVSAPGKLVYTEYFDPGDVGGDMGEGALITMELTEKQGVTTVSALMDFGTREARDAAMSTGMTDGMEMSYQALDILLDENDQS